MPEPPSADVMAIIASVAANSGLGGAHRCGPITSPGWFDVARRLLKTVTPELLLRISSQALSRLTCATFTCTEFGRTMDELLKFMCAIEPMLPALNVERDMQQSRLLVAEALLDRAEGEGSAAAVDFVETMLDCLLVSAQQSDGPASVQVHL